MIKKVLSIDLDFILKPIIQLYNDMVKKEPYQLLWSKIEEERCIQDFLKYDEDKLKFIYDILNTINLKKIYYGNSHESILLAIQEEIGKNDKIELYNIDHHHDINYNIDQENLALIYDVVDCGSWVTLLHKNKLIQKYIWIKNSNSKKYRGKKESSPYLIEYNFEDYSQITFSDFDMIYITSSQQWFPPKFLYIIEDLKKFLNQKFEIIDYGWQEFNENGQSRKLILK
jgi:hypothetical protein